MQISHIKALKVFLRCIACKSRIRCNSYPPFRNGLQCSNCMDNIKGTEVWWYMTAVVDDGTAEAQMFVDGERNVLRCLSTRYLYSSELMNTFIALITNAVRKKGYVKYDPNWKASKITQSGDSVSCVEEEVQQIFCQQKSWRWESIRHCTRRDDLVQEALSEIVYGRNGSQMLKVEGRLAKFEDTNRKHPATQSVKMQVVKAQEWHVSERIDVPTLFSNYIFIEALRINEIDPADILGYAYDFLNNSLAL